MMHLFFSSTMLERRRGVLCPKECKLQEEFLLLDLALGCIAQFEFPAQLHIIIKHLLELI